MIVPAGFGPWQAGLDEPERSARCRELRALAVVYCGRQHPLTLVLAAAIADAESAEQARAVLSALPALQRRRLLASYGALL
jgi:hypothetical protein